MTPLALRCIDAVLERLRDIRVDNGYLTNAGEHVHFSNRQPPELPAIVVWEGREQVTGGGGEVDSWTTALEINVEALVSADQDCTGRELAQVKADIKQALFRADEAGLVDAGERVAKLKYLGAQPLARPDGSTVEGVVVNAEARYKEGYGNPYAPL